LPRKTLLMENFILKSENKGLNMTPEIDFNAETGKCVVSGYSFMDSALEFYEPVLNWMRLYFKLPAPKVDYEIRLKYFNSSSYRSIGQILDLLKGYRENGGDLNVTWFYDANDDELIEDIEDLAFSSNLDVKITAE